MRSFFDLLALGDYSAALGMFGGSFDELVVWNPDLDPQDHLALFQRGCEQNGPVCSLSVKNIVSAVQLSECDFRLTVEFQQPDGSLFAQGPCCGADPSLEPPLTQFDYHLRKVDNQFLVLDMPVYVP